MKRGETVAKRYLVCSGKGGAGKSTTAVCLAKAFSVAGKRVLLVDCDIGLRCLDVLLGLKTAVYDWSDIIEDRCSVSDALCKTEDGKLALLVPPTAVTELPSAAAFSKMLSLVEKEFDFVLLDAPAGLYGIVPILSEVADEALLVATPDAVSARAAAVLSEALYDSRPQLSQRLLLNRFDADAVKFGISLSPDSMVTQTCVQLLGAVPEDAHLTALSAGEHPAAKTTEAFERIVARMLGDSVPFCEKKIKSIGF